MAPESRDEVPQRDEVRQRIDSLYDQAENATGNYNATRAMASVSRSRGVPLAKRPGRRPDSALDEVARTWFDGARARLGPTVPAALPADRRPDRAAPTGRPWGRRGGDLPGGTPDALGAGPSARRSEALERAVDRVVAELAAGRPTDPASLALAARESGRAVLPGPRRPELPPATQQFPDVNAPQLMPPTPAALHREAPAGLTPVEPAGLTPVEPAGLGPVEAAGLGPAETALLPLAAPSVPQGAAVQVPRLLPGTTAPDRPSPGTSKANNQRKLAAASDVVSRYAARLAVPATPFPSAPTTAAPPAAVRTAPPEPAPAEPPALVTTAPPAPPSAVPQAAVAAAPPMPALAVPPAAVTSTPPMPMTAVGPGSVTTMPTASAAPAGSPWAVTPAPPATVPAPPPTPTASVAAPPSLMPAPPATVPAAPSTSTPLPMPPPAPVRPASDFATGQWQQPSAAPGAAAAARPTVDGWTATTAPATAPVSAPAPLSAADAGPLGLVPESSQAVRAARAIAFARAQIGKPCVWGATGPDSYDCSSLTQAAWRAAGVTLPRAAHQQALAGAACTLAGIEPGDLVLFFDDDRHVGLYVGDGMMVHAPGPGSSIREESIYGAGESAIHRIVRPA